MNERKLIEILGWARRLPLACCVLILGCASPAENVTPERYRDVSPVDLELLVPYSPQEVASRLAKALKSCVAKQDGAAGPPLTRVFTNDLIVDSAGDDKRAYVTLSVQWRDIKNVILLIDVQAESSSASKVVARGEPVGWKKMALHTGIWIEDPNHKGPSVCG